MKSTSNKRIILARHGETVANRDNLIMGRSDFPLTTRGIATAQEIAVMLKTERIEAVFSSSLGRAVASAKIYSGNLGLPIFIRENMAELSCGKWEGKSRIEVRPDGRPLRSSWSEKPPSGESYLEAEVRVSGFIQEIASNEGQTILVVGHAAVNRVFLKLILGLDPAFAVLIQSPHNTIYVIQKNTVVSRSTTGVETKGFILGASSGRNFWI